MKDPKCKKCGEMVGGIFFGDICQKCMSSEERVKAEKETDTLMKSWVVKKWRK